MTDALICDAARTPIGRYGGALSSVRTDDLGAIPIAALVERNQKLDPAAYQLRRNGGRFALCTMCIGVGQGIAMIIESI